MRRAVVHNCGCIVEDTPNPYLVSGRNGLPAGTIKGEIGRPPEYLRFRRSVSNGGLANGIPREQERALVPSQSTDSPPDRTRTNGRCA
jgi:hypothetical protein